MKRIQRQRTKGWRMPEGAVYVGRPSRWGNPYHSGFAWPKNLTITKTAADLVALYDGWLIFKLTENPDFLVPLRGHDLVCWCPLDKRCHADVLLELAATSSEKVGPEELRAYIAQRESGVGE